jgi:hypothetical protein
MAKARRKMRRALMKKMRKGALTPGERRDLMELDREVNRANRQAAGMGGAGLAAALAIASKAGAGDALGDFLDERKKKKADAEAQELKEKEDQRKMEEEFGIRLAEGADRAEEAEREEDRQNLLKRAEEAEKRELAQEKLRADMDKAAQDNPALAALLGRDVEQPEPVQTSKYESGEGTAFEDLPKNRELMVRGEAGPTRDNAGFQEAERVQAVRQAIQDFRDSQPTDLERREDRLGILDARERERLTEGDSRFYPFEPPSNMEKIVGPGREQGFDDPRSIGAMPATSGTPVRMGGPRAEEGREMPDPDRPVMTRQGMDLDTMIRMGGRAGSEEDRDAGLAAQLSDYSPEEIEALIRYDLRQAQGGTTPFLRKMRDRIRKKFR